MNGEMTRELTVLEYTILGLLSTGPQTGYSVIGALEKSAHSTSASSGAVYPALKRLERHGIIEGELEAIYETRPRKVYRLTSIGERLLDEWLRAPLSQTEVLEERGIVLSKFLFAEKRLARAEVIEWLNAYEKATDTYDATRRIFFDMTMSVSSPHQQLILEATRMELDMQRAWIKVARRRLETEAAQS